MSNQLIFGKGTIMENGYGMVPKKVMQDKELTIEAKSIYCYFMSYAGAGNTAFPSISRIIGDLKISKDRYYNHLELLKKLGYIKVYKNKSAEGKFLNNIYEIQAKPCPEDRETDNPDTDNLATNSNTSKSNRFNIKKKGNKGGFSKENRSAYYLNYKTYLNPILGYFYREYETIFNQSHPPMKKEQLKHIYDVLDDYNDYFSSLQDWQRLIDSYFKKNFQDGCDYRLNHFVSGDIIYLRGLELGLLDPDYDRHIGS